jgi:hypothetical protein
MKPKFQADADLNEDIVTGVLRRIPEIDFQTANEAGFEGIADENVLEIASLENRILVSHDRKTMPTYFAEFIQKQNSPGVLIISQKLEIGTAIEELILVWAASEAEEYINAIRQIPI